MLSLFSVPLRLLGFGLLGAGVVMCFFAEIPYLLVPDLGTMQTGFGVAITVCGALPVLAWVLSGFMRDENRQVLAFFGAILVAFGVAIALGTVGNYVSGRLYPLLLAASGGVLLWTISEHR